MSSGYDEQILLGYVEDELDGAERAQVERWRTSDPRLARLLDGMAEDRRSLRGLADPTLPAWAMEEVDRRLERSMLLEDSPNPIASPSGGRRRIAGPMLAVGALAALLALVAGVVFYSLNNRGEPSRQFARNDPRESDVSRVEPAPSASEERQADESSGALEPENQPYAGPPSALLQEGGAPSPAADQTDADALARLAEKAAESSASGSYAQPHQEAQPAPPPPATAPSDRSAQAFPPPRASSAPRSAPPPGGGVRASSSPPAVARQAAGQGSTSPDLSRRRSRVTPPPLDPRARSSRASGLSGASSGSYSGAESRSLPPYSYENSENEPPLALRSERASSELDRVPPPKRLIPEAQRQQLLRQPAAEANADRVMRQLQNAPRRARGYELRIVSRDPDATRRLLRSTLHPPREPMRSSSTASMRAVGAIDVPLQRLPEVIHALRSGEPQVSMEFSRRPPSPADAQAGQAAQSAGEEDSPPSLINWRRLLPRYAAMFPRPAAPDAGAPPVYLPVVIEPAPAP